PHELGGLVRGQPAEIVGSDPAAARLVQIALEAGALRLGRREREGPALGERAVDSLAPRDLADLVDGAVCLSSRPEHRVRALPRRVDAPAARDAARDPAAVAAGRPEGRDLTLEDDDAEVGLLL